jgi:hypothetical protein
MSSRVVGSAHLHTLPLMRSFAHILHAFESVLVKFALDILQVVHRRLSSINTVTRSRTLPVNLLHLRHRRRMGNHHATPVDWDLQQVNRSLYLYLGEERHYRGPAE